MLGSKNILTLLIPDCSVLRTLTILKNIRNPLIFLRKMATYSCFWRVPRSEIFLQASLRQISDLLTLVSSHYGDGDPSGIPVPCIYLHDLYNHLVSMIYSLFVLNFFVVSVYYVVAVSCFTGSLRSTACCSTHVRTCTLSTCCSLCLFIYFCKQFLCTVH